MENLFPLFFIIYIISTVVSAVMKRRQGGPQRRVPPPTQRPFSRPDMRREPPLEPPLERPVPPRPEAELEQPPVVERPVTAEEWPIPELQPTRVEPMEDGVEGAKPERADAVPEGNDLAPMTPPLTEGRPLSRPPHPDVERRRPQRPAAALFGEGVRLTPQDVRRGILLAEILGPPRALRPYSPPRTGPQRRP